MKIIDGDWTERPRASGDGTYFVLESRGASIAVVTTAGSRAVVADPELVGQRYIDEISSATAEAMRAIRWEDHGLTADDRPHPLVILRGGATFSPQSALELLGHPPGGQSFLTSESHRPADGPSSATQRYFKFEEIEGSNSLLICDIVATGGTVLAAAQKALEHAPSIRHLVVVGFITVEGAARIIEQLRGQLSVLVVAFEALFRLPEEQDRSRANTTPCDFRRSDIVCDPHLIRLLQDRPELALEQCVIYDGGERAFSPTTHLRGRAGYLRQVNSLSAAERWDEVKYRSGVIWDAGLVLGDPRVALNEREKARDSVEARFPATATRPQT